MQGPLTHYFLPPDGFSIFFFQEFWEVARENISNLVKEVGEVRASFKISSKILNNMLSPIISQMIGNYQMGFIRGHSILQGIIIANRVNYQCSKTNLNGYLLKLDFEKTYDTVS